MSSAERDEIRRIIANLQKSLESAHGITHTNAIRQAMADLREMLVKG